MLLFGVHPYLLVLCLPFFAWALSVTFGAKAAAYKAERQPQRQYKVWNIGDD